MKTALILGGGGTHCAIEVGVMQYLIKKKIIPHLIIGTSVGSINGAFFAEDPTIENMQRLEQVWLKCMKSKNLFPIRKEIFFKFGKIQSIYDPDPINTTIIDEVRSTTFEQLKIKLYVNCTRLDTGENVFFSKGQLKKTLLASCGLIPFMPPVKINGKLYADGGFSSNLGLNEAKKLRCQKVIVIESPHRKMIKNPNGVHDYIMNSVNVLTNQLREDEIKLSKMKKVIIEPKPRKDIGSIFDFKNTEYLIKLGENTAREVLG